MRRIVFIAVTGAALLAFGPGSALARGHHRRHHHRSHHHVRFHRERWGSDRGAGGSGSEGTAGTVASFTGGVLTLMLNDGSMVSGRVTDATELECEAADNESMQSDERSSSGDDNGDQGGDNGDQGENNDEQGEDQGENEQNCTTTDLSPGAVVQEAELKVSSGGAIWDKVDLIAHK